MITNEDIKRLQLPKLTPDQIRRISNAETACKNSLIECTALEFKSSFKGGYIWKFKREDSRANFSLSE